MQKKQSSFIVFLTAAVVVALTALVGITITSVNRRVEQSCFERLADTAK